MKKTTPFSKYCGNGNDFILIQEKDFDWDQEKIASLCHRRFGIGADGVVVMGVDPALDATMRIFNSDGLEATMCGNGLRCLAHYLYDHVTQKSEYRIKTMNSVFLVRQLDERFFIEMSVAEDIGRFDLSEFNNFSQSFFINTGVPHLCFIVDDARAIDIGAIAPFYRHNPLFPQGTNVNFIEILDEEKQRVYVRTFERGVEDETYSCGTGVTACAHTLKHLLGWQGSIQLENLGGEHLVEMGNVVLFSGVESFVYQGLV